MFHNVLITSAGRRGKLVELFRRELESVLPGRKVFAADRRPELSVACQLADGSLKVPSVDAAGYLSRLHELCRRYEIGLIVPTIDTELELLARHREEFAVEGVQIVVSDLEFVQTCGDKRRTRSWFSEQGLAVPRPADPHIAAAYPIFAKPYDGSCGRGARLVATRDELTPSVLDDPHMMYLEYISPSEHDEYTIDIYYSREGQLRCLVPRLRIETRAGEVSKSRTERIAEIDWLRGHLGSIEGAHGCITLQIFLNRTTRALYGIEINPRFGGGYPLSYEAGANFPRWLIEEYLLGLPIESNDDWECDLTMLRYDDHVLVRNRAA